jgi:aspartate aminotransferase/aminotransferase
MNHPLPVVRGGEPRLSRAVADVPEAMSIKFNTLVYEMRARGRDVIALSLGEAFFDIPLFPFEDLPYPDLYHYSHSRGLPELRTELARYYAAYGVAVDPEREILVTAGSKAAIHMTFMSVLQPGDEAIVLEPAWVSYAQQIALCGARAVGVPWNVNAEELERYVTPRTRAIVVNTPQNPTGRLYSRAELQSLYRLAERHGLWLLSDEAYSEFVLDGTFVSAAALDSDRERVIVFNSLSKNCGMSGWRLGYAIGPRRLIDALLKVNQHLLTCPATVLELYLAKHFRRVLEIARPQVKSVVERRGAMARYLDELGIDYLPGTATFYLFASIAPSRLGSEAFSLRLLQEEGVCVVPGVGYGASCDGFVRISVGTENDERLRAAVRRMKSLIDRT